MIRFLRDRNPWFTIAATFIVLCGFRAVEFLLIRTDRMAVGEAVLHLALALAVLTAILRIHNIRFSQIGFTKTHAPRDFAQGLLFAGFVFLLTYGFEVFVLKRMGRSPRIVVYVLNNLPDFLSGSRETLNIFALALGAALTVTAEEGIFRGLFIYLAEKRTDFKRALLLSAFLYGLWGYVVPLRYFVERDQHFWYAVSLGGLLFLSQFMLGIKYTLEYEMTGSLWFPMADHLLYYLLLRVVHVTGAGLTDELFLMRAAVAQALSLIFILVIFIRLRRVSREYGG